MLKRLSIAVLTASTGVYGACAQQILAPAQVRGKQVLLVIGEPEKDQTSDDMIVKKHLEDQGYIVSTAREDDPPQRLTART